MTGVLVHKEFTQDSLFSSDCKVKTEAPQAQSDEDAEWLWKESVKWTKLDKED